MAWAASAQCGSAGLGIASLSLFGVARRYCFSWRRSYRIHFQSHLKVGRHDRGRGAPDRSRRRHSHCSTPGQYMGTAAGPDQSSSSSLAPTTGSHYLQGNCNTREEGALEAQHTWHNALSLSVLHGRTPGDSDPQTIPTRVHFSVPCSCLQQYN